MAARTVGAALGPTDVPVCTVSLARSAREVRAHPCFYVDTVLYVQSSFQLSLYRYDTALLESVLDFFGENMYFFNEMNLIFVVLAIISIKEL